MPITPQLLNAKREEGCFAFTADRKYYHVGDTFIKRSLRPSEWQTSPLKGTLHFPGQGRERVLNEAAAMKYIAMTTEIPVPKLYCSFEDDGAVYLVMEYIEGVSMASLDDHQRSIVQRGLDQHVDALHQLRSKFIGGPSGLVVPPYRVTQKTAREEWNLRPSESEKFVFCHNDLSMHNTIVDPVSLKIRAIIDWEYAGFYPENFDAKFYYRLGPSVAIEGEEDDSDALLRFLMSRQE